jgi:hypothetical protein
MSDNVKVPYGRGEAGETATLLLAAAEEKDADPGVVKWRSGHFLAPEEVAKAAGVDYESEEADTEESEDAEEKPKKTTAKRAAKKSTTGKE